MEEVDVDMQDSPSYLPECPICLDVLGTFGGPVTLKCGHNGCKFCLVKVQRSNARCPKCRMDCSQASLAINLELEMMLAMTKVLASCDRSPEMVAAAAQQAEDNIRVIRDERNKIRTHVFVVIVTLADMQHYFANGGRAGLLDLSQAERVCLPRSASLAHVHSLACAKTGRQPNHFQLRPWVGRGNDTIRPADVLFKGRNLQQALAPGNITYAGGVCPKTGIKIFYIWHHQGGGLHAGSRVRSHPRSGAYHPFQTWPAKGWNISASLRGSEAGICNPLPPASSLEQAELRDGDILIVQSPSDISAVAEDQNWSQQLSNFLLGQEAP
ncbi:hypothetical protein WJX84_006285 [Apatococcus fuscideae]|uniref:RING-type domain-containing protein n=1 Tax=Apatococcus fuscideae TaxID=2026836 RepID=A0AAW1TJL1_9CHLO